MGLKERTGFEDNYRKEDVEDAVKELKKKLCDGCNLDVLCPERCPHYKKIDEVFGE